MAEMVQQLLGEKNMLLPVDQTVEAGMAAAEKISGVVSHHVIASPETDTEKMLKLSALDKK